MTSYLQDVVLAKHIHAVVLSVTRYFPALLPYHAWFMWTFREQPRPVRWREFVAGIWSRLSGSETGGPWPRISEIDAEAGQLAKDRAAAAAAVPARATSSAVSESAIAGGLPFHPVDSSTLPKLDATLESVAETGEPGKLAEPVTLTPPYTPAAQSPTGGVEPIRPDSPSSELELSKSDVAQERQEHGVSSPHAGRAKELWPILEDEPVYRVDWGVNIFNYDCGLSVPVSPRSCHSIFRVVDQDVSHSARSTPMNPASRMKRPAPRWPSCTSGMHENSPSPATHSGHTSQSKFATWRRTRRGSVRPDQDQAATLARSSTGKF